MLIDGYVRVSRVGDRGGESFISPSVQRDQIEAWAKLSEATVGRIFEELDESGARSDRPLLMEAIERVETGGSQGIVVAKLDRFGRSLVDGLANIERISDAGGTFVSVQDGLDLGTPTGRLILRIMFSMAEWELDRVRANWDVAQGRAVARGVHPVAFVPLGYRRGADRRLKVDPEKATIIRELFRRRANGEPMVALMAFLNGTGLQTVRGGKHFIASSVAGIIRNRAYLGEAAFGQHFNPRAHTALVDEATWQDAQRPRKKRGKRRTSLLVSVLRCGTCRLSMATWDTVRKEAKAVIYRCPTHSSAGRCPGPASILGEDIEPLVEEFVFKAAKSKEQGRRGIHKRIGQLEYDLAAAQGRASRYRDNVSLSDRLAPESFAAGLGKRQEIVERVALELAGARRAAQSPDVPSADEIESVWPSLSMHERRAIVEEFVDCVFIDRGKEPAIERAHVCRRGDAPFDVPRAGVPIGEVKSFDSRGSRAVRLRAPRKWSQTRIERELKLFVGDRNDWPRYVEFAIEGRARLYHQVMEWGGPYLWAHRLELEVNFRAVQWTDRRIRGALRGFLHGREFWPGGADFRAEGLDSLSAAVKRHRGIEAWAAEFELPYSGPTKPPSWTDDRIRSELEAFLGGRDQYPRPSVFIKAGHEDLYLAVKRNGGHDIWANTMGFEQAPERRSR